jgi:hypothetical protein
MVVKKKGVKKKSSAGTGTALTEADTFVYEIPLVRSRSALGEPNPMNVFRFRTLPPPSPPSCVPGWVGEDTR